MDFWELLAFVHTSHTNMGGVMDCFRNCGTRVGGLGVSVDFCDLPAFVHNSHTNKGVTVWILGLCGLLFATVALKREGLGFRV